MLSKGRFVGNVIVTREQIRELPRKYAIGKRPLSKVLGWGELTYTRILDGSTPSDGHAREILRALEDPVSFSMLLEDANRKGIISTLCYERSRQAVEGCLQEDERADSTIKLHEVGKAICIMVQGDVTPEALQLFMYLAQGMSLRDSKTAIFEQLPVATEQGPAYPELKTWFTRERIAKCAESRIEDTDLSKREIDILGEMVEEYGIYSRRGLQKIACEQAPWKKARKKALKAGECEAIISLKSMAKFFSK